MRAPRVKKSFDTPAESHHRCGNCANPHTNGRADCVNNQKAVKPRERYRIVCDQCDAVLFDENRKAGKHVTGCAGYINIKFVAV